MPRFQSLLVDVFDVVKFGTVQYAYQEVMHIKGHASCRGTLYFFRWLTRVQEYFN